MKKTILIILVLVVAAVVFYSLNNSSENNKPKPEVAMTNNDVQIVPISHATLYLEWQGKAILTDPTGDASLYVGQPTADVILVTDIHGDHFSTSTLEALVKDNTKLVVPKAVADLLTDSLKAKNIVMANGDVMDVAGFKIEAVPMYNIPESATAFHTKGRGNGYVIEAGGKRVYVAGDTSATPEMKALKNIDIAFLPMNLPYTMDVEEAAQGALAFKPKEVIPYHYKGSDTNKFKELVNAGDPNINVSLIDFYPQQ